MFFVELLELSLQVGFLGFGHNDGSRGFTLLFVFCLFRNVLVKKFTAENTLFVLFAFALCDETFCLFLFLDKEPLLVIVYGANLLKIAVLRSTLVLSERGGFRAHNDSSGSVLAVLDFVDSVFENLVFVLSKQANEGLSQIKADDTLISDVIAHERQAVFVELDDFVETAFADVERGERGQEIISDKETEENEIVNDTLKVELHAHFAFVLSILKHKVLAQQRNVDELVVVSF